VLQFDQERGYGFIAADDGGEDVFLHASVFDGDSYDLAPGVRIEFKVMAGDRGRKAFAAHPIPDEPEAAGSPVPPPPVATALAVQPPAVPRPAPAPVQSPALTALVPPQPPQSELEAVADDESMCDVLSPVEFSQELTEVLLSNAPTLTGRQVLEVRESVLEYAKKHGWVDI
jgi:cold shock CspA family protein